MSVEVVFLLQKGCYVAQFAPWQSSRKDMQAFHKSLNESLQKNPKMSFNALIVQRI